MKLLESIFQLGDMFAVKTSFVVLEIPQLGENTVVLCVGLVLSFGLIGGIISYFVLRKDDPKKAKIFLYIGIVLTAIGIAVDVAFGPQIMELDQGFGVNI